MNNTNVVQLPGINMTKAEFQEGAVNGKPIYGSFETRPGNNKGPQPMMPLTPELLDSIVSDNLEIDDMQIQPNMSLAWSGQKECKLYHTDADRLEGKIDFLRAQLGYLPLKMSRVWQQHSAVLNTNVNMVSFVETERVFPQRDEHIRMAIINALVPLESEYALKYNEQKFRREFKDWLEGKRPAHEYASCSWLAENTKRGIAMPGRDSPENKAAIEAARSLVRINPGFARTGILFWENIARKAREKRVKKRLAAMTPMNDEEAWVYYSVVVRDMPLEFIAREAGVGTNPDEPEDKANVKIAVTDNASAAVDPNNNNPPTPAQAAPAENDPATSKTIQGAVDAATVPELPNLWINPDLAPDEQEVAKASIKDQLALWSKGFNNAVHDPTPGGSFKREVQANMLESAGYNEMAKQLKNVTAQNNQLRKENVEVQKKLEEYHREKMSPDTKKIFDAMPRAEQEAMIKNSKYFQDKQKELDALINENKALKNGAMGNDAAIAKQRKQIEELDAAKKNAEQRVALMDEKVKAATEQLEKAKAAPLPVTGMQTEDRAVLNRRLEELQAEREKLVSKLAEETGMKEDLANKILQEQQNARTAEAAQATLAKRLKDAEESAKTIEGQLNDAKKRAEADTTRILELQEKEKRAQDRGMAYVDRLLAADFATVTAQPDDPMPDQLTITDKETIFSHIFSKGGRVALTAQKIPAGSPFHFFRKEYEERYNKGFFGKGYSYHAWEDPDPVIKQRMGVAGTRSETKTKLEGQATKSGMALGVGQLGDDGKIDPEQVKVNSTIQATDLLTEGKVIKRDADNVPLVGAGSNTIHEMTEEQKAQAAFEKLMKDFHTDLGHLEKSLQAADRAKAIDYVKRANEKQLANYAGNYTINGNDNNNSKAQIVPLAAKVMHLEALAESLGFNEQFKPADVKQPKLKELEDHATKLLGHLSKHNAHVEGMMNHFDHARKSLEKRAKAKEALLKADVIHSASGKAWKAQREVLGLTPDEMLEHVLSLEKGEDFYQTFSQKVDIQEVVNPEKEPARMIVREEHGDEYRRMSMQEIQSLINQYTETEAQQKARGGKTSELLTIAQAKDLLESLEKSKRNKTTLPYREKLAKLMGAKKLIW